jgi:hypothetical protein
MKVMRTSAQDVLKNICSKAIIDESSRHGFGVCCSEGLNGSCYIDGVDGSDTYKKDNCIASSYYIILPSKKLEVKTDISKMINCMYRSS